MESSENSQASAIVLAGGRSERMGQPKALLRFGAETLIEHIVRVLAPAFGEVIVVAAAGQELPALPARVVTDEVPGAGPLGGLHAGLKASRTEWAFVASCDAPFLQPALALLLVERARAGVLALPEYQGRRHPLPGAYCRSLLPAIEERLGAGRLRLGALAERFGGVAPANLPGALIVPEADVLRADPEGLSFINVNTPEEYAAALSRQ